MCMASTLMLVRMKVIIVQIIHQWNTVVLYAISSWALIKHIVNKLQCPLQLTILGSCVVTMPWVAGMQS